MQPRATPRSPSNADYDALFELTSTPTLEVDADGMLVRANAAAARLLHIGVGRQQVQSLAGLLGASAMEVLGADGPHDMSAELDSGPTAVRLRAFRRTLGATAGDRFTVQIMRREGREAVDADRRSEAARLSLLDDVSHNLGTPLAIVAGYAETLAERWKDLEEKDIVAATAAINRHAHRAVNELRALQARVRVSGSGTGTVPTAVLIAWLRRILSGPLAANGTVLLDELDRAHVTIDVGLTRQALLNICQMALTSTPPPVSVTIAVATQQGGTEFRVFTHPPLQPVDAGTREARATSALATAARGRFTEATPDEPQHVLWLPDAATTERSDPPRIPVAVIEDDPDTAALIRASLHSSSAVFDLVADERTFAAGLIAVERTRPRILLLDQGLPDRLGTDGLDELHAASPGMTIVILSSHEQGRWEAETGDMRGTHWLEKPRVLADLGPELIGVLAATS